MNEEHQFQTEYKNEWTPQELQIIEGLKEIYQQAITQYPTNENLIKRYNEFLEGINDQQNQRSLLNFALELFPENRQFVWTLFEQFEKKCGTMETIMDYEEKQMKDSVMNNHTSFDNKFSFIWLKDLFTFIDQQPFTEHDDMDYKTMRQYYDGSGQFDMQMEKMNLSVGDEFDKLMQFKNILPLNYVGTTCVDVDYLIEVLEQDDDPLYFN